MPIEILMPALSPTMERGNLAKWLKKEGDTVKSGDVIAEIETDKATMEVEAVDEGTLGKILVPEGTNDVAVNTPIAMILAEGEDAAALKSAKPSRKAPADPAVAEEVAKFPAKVEELSAIKAPPAAPKPTVLEELDLPAGTETVSMTVREALRDATPPPRKRRGVRPTAAAVRPTRTGAPPSTRCHRAVPRDPQTLAPHAPVDHLSRRRRRPNVQEQCPRPAFGCRRIHRVQRSGESGEADVLDDPDNGGRRTSRCIRRVPSFFPTATPGIVLRDPRTADHRDRCRAGVGWGEHSSLEQRDAERREEFRPRRLAMAR